MGQRLSDIQAPIAEEMRRFETYFRDSMKSNVFLLDRIMRYIVRRKGKQMRPMFVLLMAKTLGGIKEPTYRGAALIELLHTATLVHDDVVDNSLYRRGFFSINALWKNKIAVLVGDYLLSRGLLLSIDNGDFRLLQLVSTAVREMSEGELLQMEKARRLDITEEVYYQIIRQKTASLIASCCAVGAASTTEDEEIISRAQTFGELVGLAFQIKDDLFDYGEAQIGKPRGIDIRERKVTLPLLHALSQCSAKERRWAIGILRNHNEERKEVAKLIEFVKAKGGLDYAIEKMEAFAAEAMTHLHQLPPGESRDSLEALVRYTIERNR